MKSDIVIVNYGIGNISSVLRAVKWFKVNCEITDNPQKIVDAKRLILPGDGAFPDTMKEINRRNLIKPIKEYIALKKPLLGICIGMQIMATYSEEFGYHQGLNLIPGKVISFRSLKQKRKPYKIPQLGWNRLLYPENQKPWKNSIFNNIKSGDYVYFIHSYVFIPDDPHCILSTTDYAGNIFASAIQKNNIIGCQFHPEKSGKTGLNILESFLNL